MPQVETPPAEQVIEEAERVVHEAQLGHTDPPPPDPPDDFGNSRRRPERRPWGWLNTLGVILVISGLAGFVKPISDIEVAASYATMLAGVVLIDLRNKKE